MIIALGILLLLAMVAGFGFLLLVAIAEVSIAMEEFYD
jgi:hypothetical protein